MQVSTRTRSATGVTGFQFGGLEVAPVVAHLDTARKLLETFAAGEQSGSTHAAEGCREQALLGEL